MSRKSDKNKVKKRTLVVLVVVIFKIKQEKTKIRVVLNYQVHKKMEVEGSNEDCTNNVENGKDIENHIKEEHKVIVLVLLYGVVLVMEEGNNGLYEKSI